VLTAGLPIPDKRFPNPEQLNAYLRQVVSQVEAVPGVRDVALTSALPMQGWGYGMPFQRADKPMVDRANRKGCFFKMVSPSYFRALGMKLRRGRPLGDHDTKGAPPVTVINETMVRLYFKDEDPIGKRILVQEIVPGKTQLGPEIAWEVVGVVADEKVNNVDSRGENPGMYISNEQSPVYFQALVVRAAMDPSGLRKALSKAVHEINKDQTLTEVKTLDQIKAESMATNRLRSLLLTVSASIAVLLAAIGIYGVISYSVEQRTREIGIRAALGASRSDLLRLILRGGMLMAGVGLVLGLDGAFGLTRLLANLLFGVGERDPRVLKRFRDCGEFRAPSLGGFVGLPVKDTGAYPCRIPSIRLCWTFGSKTVMLFSVLASAGATTPCVWERRDGPGVARRKQVALGPTATARYARTGGGSAASSIAGSLAVHVAGARGRARVPPAHVAGVAKQSEDRGRLAPRPDARL